MREPRPAATMWAVAGRVFFSEKFRREICQSLAWKLFLRWQTGGYSNYSLAWKMETCARTADKKHTGARRVILADGLNHSRRWGGPTNGCAASFGLSRILRSLPGTGNAAGGKFEKFEVGRLAGGEVTQGARLGHVEKR